MTIFKSKNPAFFKFVALQLQIGIAYVKTVLSKSETSLLVMTILQPDEFALSSAFIKFRPRHACVAVPKKNSYIKKSNVLTTMEDQRYNLL
jgi:hypothetical protein